MIDELQCVFHKDGFVFGKSMWYFIITESNLKIIVGDGKPRLTLAVTPDLDWLLQIGMLRAGLEIVTTDIGRDEDDG